MNECTWADTIASAGRGGPGASRISQFAEVGGSGGGGGFVRGGVIFNAGSLAVMNSTFHTNSANAGSGGTPASGSNGGVKALLLSTFSRGLEEREDVRAIKAGDAAECGDRGTHLAAFDGAEKADGYAGGFGDLRERKAAARAEAAKALPGSDRGFRRRGYDALPLENVDYGGGVHAASTAKKYCALEQTDIAFGVQAIAAGGALWHDKPEGFPGAQCG